MRFFLLFRSCFWAHVVMLLVLVLVHDGGEGALRILPLALHPTKYRRGLANIAVKVR